MKKIVLSAILFAALSLNSLAQSPEGFKYQAVVRDASQNVLPNQAVGVQITILQGSATGTVVYQETFSSTTNGYGLINLAIGNGTVVSGTFSTIDWSAGPYFIETAIDAAEFISASSFLRLLDCLAQSVRSVFPVATRCGTVANAKIHATPRPVQI